MRASSRTPDQYALFGALNYALSDRLKVRGGLRDTKDKKDFLALRVEDRTASHGLNSDSSNLSWDLSGTCTVDRDANVFGRIATGHRARRRSNKKT